MNFEQVGYIVNVARTGSISSTAEIMHVSQAGISKAIMKLEKEIGFELFRRTRHGMIPTEKGKVLIASANEILLKVQEFKDSVYGQQKQLHGDIRLSVSPNFISILPKAIMSFKVKNPYVKLEITERDSIEIIEDIREDRSDLGLVYFNPSLAAQYKKDLWLTTMLETRLVVCVNRNSELASKNRVGVSELLNQTFVSVNGRFSKHTMDQIAQKYGPVKIMFTATNQDVLKRTIAEGDVIGIFMEFTILNDPLVIDGDIVAIPLEDNELDYKGIPIGYVRSKWQHFSTTHYELIKHIQMEIESQIASKLG